MTTDLSEADRKYWKSHRAEVICENLERIRPVALRIRTTISQTLIDPTTLTMDGWEQAEYHEFWCQVIRKWCFAVVLSEGWAFSTGCCEEAATALELGLQTWREDLNPITAEVIKGEVLEARHELQGSGMATQPYLIAASKVLRDSKSDVSSIAATVDTSSDSQEVEE